jgi:hypothetical protein
VADYNFATTDVQAITKQTRIAPSCEVMDLRRAMPVRETINVDEDIVKSSVPNRNPLDKLKG